MRHRYSLNIARKNIWQLFFLYSCFVFYVVFLTPNRYRGDDSYRVNLLPVVKTMQAVHEQGNEHFWPYYIGYWGNIFGNIILFFPCGFLFSSLYPHKRFTAIATYGLLISVGVELSQLVLRIGVCDIDDVILNGIGVAAGAGLFRVLKKRISINQ